MCLQHSIITCSCVCVCVCNGVFLYAYALCSSCPSFVTWSEFQIKVLGLNKMNERNENVPRTHRGGGGKYSSQITFLESEVFVTKLAICGSNVIV